MEEEGGGGREEACNTSTSFLGGIVGASSGFIQNPYRMYQIGILNLDAYYAYYARNVDD